MSTAAVGPLLVSTGATVPGQTIEANNLGDGSLSLRYSSNATWLTAGAGGTCSAGNAGCTPILLSMNTAGLAKGAYTGMVTVSDPNAVDAPQTISVTMIVGGGVPDKMDFYAPPGGSPVDMVFTAGNELNFNVQGGFLSILEDGSGSFRFQRPFRPFPYRARATVGELGEGTYNGSITVSGGSLVPADNKTVPVTLRVTSQPIVQLSAIELNFTASQNSHPRDPIWVSAANLGRGTLTLSGATATLASGTGWLTSSIEAGLVRLKIDPANLAPGVYRGTVNVASNAVNGAQTLPVTLTVLATGAPVVNYNDITSVAGPSQGDVVGQGSFLQLKGIQFGNTIAVANSLPYPATLSGAQVFVNDRPAPVQYVQDDQINFQLPYDVPAGTALVRVERQGQRSNTVSLRVEPAAPRLYLYLGGYAILTHIDGALVLPASTGLGRPAKKGDTVTIWAVGLGQTSPAVTAGVAPGADPFKLVPNTTVTFGGGLINTAYATPSFAGLAPTFPGLYLVNVTIPDDAPTGDNVSISLNVGNAASNVGKIAIQ